MGKVSTHAVIYARLIIDGKDYGVNGNYKSKPIQIFSMENFLLCNKHEMFPFLGFIVQLRSLDDHLPLPGITVGDIGMKFGSGAYNTMDNGVLRFDHVRIPRDQMLMRFVCLFYMCLFSFLLLLLFLFLPPS